MKVDSHHYSHDQQPRRPRKGRGQLRRDKERAAKHRAGAALGQNAKTTSDNINESTAAVDSNDGNIQKVQELSNRMSRGGRIHAYVAAFRGTLCPLVPALPFWL